MESTLMSPAYANASRLLRSEDPDSMEKGLALYRAEVEARPSDMKALFEYAGAFDFMGREAEALPHYQKILLIGFEKLPLDDQPRLFVQLGSTFRNLKQFSESREVLEKGIRNYSKYCSKNLRQNRSATIHAP